MLVEIGGSMRRYVERSADPDDSASQCNIEHL